MLSIALKILSKHYYYSDVKEELLVVSKMLEVPLEDIFLASIIYELHSHKTHIGCSSIIVRNNQGEIFFGRNLDYFL